MEMNARQRQMSIVGDGTDFIFWALVVARGNRSSVYLSQFLDSTWLFVIAMATYPVAGVYYAFPVTRQFWREFRFWG